MFIAFKALGATFVAGALAASGVVTGDHLIDQADKDDGASTAVTADPHAILEALAVGEETEVSADEAGTASVKRTDAGLEILSVAPADGWTAEIRTLAADWALIEFGTPGRKVDLSLDIAGENLRIRRSSFEVDIPTTTTTEPPTTTTTEPPTTTTTEAPPPVAPPVTLPPPAEPTVVPVAGAGSVVIELQGPVIVVQQVKVVPGWTADVERRSGDINVVFRNGDRSFRFLASFKDRRLLSDVREIREIRADRDGRDGRDGDRDGRQHGDRRGDGDRDRDGRH